MFTGKVFHCVPDNCIIKAFLLHGVKLYDTRTFKSCWKLELLINLQRLQSSSNRFLVFDLLGGPDPPISPAGSHPVRALNKVPPVFQLSNLDSVSSMLRMAGQELLMLMAERLAQTEAAAYSQRAEVEEDRVQYVFTEEKLLTQLR